MSGLWGSIRSAGGIFLGCSHTINHSGWRINFEPEAIVISESTVSESDWVHEFIYAVFEMRSLFRFM